MKTRVTKLIYAAFAAIVVATGAVTANGAVNDLFVSVNGFGNGGGSIYHYTPTGVRSIFSSGLSHPRGVAFDQSANLFVATNTFDSTTGTYSAAILKILPDGTPTTFANINGPSADFFAEDVKCDSAGNVFVMVEDSTDPNAASTIYKFAPNGTQSTFGTVPGQGFGLAFDGAGNLYAADSLDVIIYKFTTNGTRTVFASIHGLGLAFDRAGNLFLSNEGDPGTPFSNTILKFTPNGTLSTFATGLHTPRGLAFNRGGILFVTEDFLLTGGGPGDILRFTPNGIGTVFASGIGTGNRGPEYLAVQPPPQH